MKLYFLTQIVSYLLQLANIQYLRNISVFILRAKFCQGNLYETLKFEFIISGTTIYGKYKPSSWREYGSYLVKASCLSAFSQLCIKTEIWHVWCVKVSLHSVKYGCGVGRLGADFFLSPPFSDWIWSWVCLPLKRVMREHYVMLISAEA
jgi:hypothetical protein